MSERGPWKTSTAYSWTIVVFDSSGAAVTGLLNAGFTTKQLAKDDANSAVSVTVTEIDSANLPGWYKVTYTPNATGHWVCRVAHPTYNTRGWLDEIQVGSRGFLDDLDITNLDAAVSSRLSTASYYIRSNTAQAGAASTITLDAAASATDSFYNKGLLVILSGTGAGQARWITGYVGATKVATVDSAWLTNPDATSVFGIIPKNLAGQLLDAAITTRATPAQILATPANLLATDGTGRVTVGTNADKTGYSLAVTPLTLAQIVNGVWDELQSGHVTAGTFGKLMGFLDAAISSRAAPSDVPSAATIAALVWSLAGAIDGTITPEKALTYVFAAVAGVSAGEPAGAEDTFKGPSGTIRLRSTYDSDNNRTGTTLA